VGVDRDGVVTHKDACLCAPRILREWKPSTERTSTHSMTPAGRKTNEDGSDSYGRSQRNGADVLC
jgi:hypothetical protein